MGKPFVCVGMDFKEMDQSFDNNHCALVFQGYLTKWLEVYTVTDLTLAMVAGCLYVADLIYKHDEFTFLIYDRAVEFLSDVLQDTALFQESNSFLHHPNIHSVTT